MEEWPVYDALIMKNIQTYSLLLILSALAGCSSSSKNTGGTPSVSGASPAIAFLGSTLDVQLQGSNTTWDATTTADFGAGVTVNKLTLVSASALIANITVAKTATAGKRNITVTQGKTMETYTMDFAVSASATITSQGTVSQGSVINLKLINLDTSVPYDTTNTQDPFSGQITYTNLNFTGGTGLTYSVTNATANEADVQIFIDVMATAGAVDLTLANGDPNNTPLMTTFPAAFTVAARTATTLTPNAMADFTQPFASTLYKITPTGANDILNFGITAASQTSMPLLLLLDSTGSFAGSGFINNGTSFEYDTTDTSSLYVIALDFGATGGYMATVTSSDIALTIQAGGEGNDTTNNVYTGATVLSAPPVEVQGASLSSATDIDFYAVTVPAGKSIHVQTVPGDDATEATVIFYNSDGTTVLPDPDQTDPTMPVDMLGPEDTVSNAVTTAGTYYIAIGFSQDPSATPWAADESHYNLIVTLE
jgi:hypothetical protein